jgi:calcineurin-like phosphoesterase family protein
MTTWFTADLHLGHANIIKYCARPFDDVEEMHSQLIERWNGAVEPKDTVWVLGDFALGKIDETLPMAAELAGKKILLAGNHDRCWDGHGSKAQGWTQRYLDAGFATVAQGQSKLKIGSTRVSMSHFPYWGDSQDQDRFVDHRPTDKGAWLIHGHVHERWAQRGRMIIVGVDATGFRPISEAEVAAMIQSGPAERHAEPAPD